MSVVAASRADKVALVRVAKDAHPYWTRAQIADQLGIKLGTLHALLNDPDGAKQRARRERYTGVCVDCGAQTRSDGTSRPSSRCGPCSKPEKFWTRERVVDAIQRFAAANGRPPTAREWVSVDRVNGYPSQRNVSAGRAAVFVRWADAIEAAGFPRPRVGHWQDESRRSAQALERVGPLQQAVLDDLADGPRRLAWLAAGRSYNSVGYALRGLIARGLVERISRGVYRRAF